MRQSDMQSASAHPNLLITHAQPNSGAWQHTLNIWISRVCVPPWKQSWWGEKEFWVFTGKKNKAKKKLWLDFCLVFPAAALATFYTMKKERKEKNVSCLLLFSQVSFMVLPLPALSEDESLSCAFGTLPAEPAIVNANRITCQSPPPIRLPPSPPGSGECFWSLCLLRKFPPASLLLAREHANPH